MTVRSHLDRFIAGILFIRIPEQQPAAACDVQIDKDQIQRTERVFGLSLAFSGVRCVLQYVVLPFILPVVGIAGSFANQLTLVISIVAIIAMIASIRRFWRIDYAYKWHYLGVSLVAIAIITYFIIDDLQHLMG